MSKPPSLDQTIAQAIDTQNATLAGCVADFCRFKLGMNYQQTLARVQSIRPNVTPGDWDALLSESED